MQQDWSTCGHVSCDFCCCASACFRLGLAPGSVERWVGRGRVRRAAMGVAGRQPGERHPAMLASAIYSSPILLFLAACRPQSMLCKGYTAACAMLPSRRDSGACRCEVFVCAAAALARQGCAHLRVPALPSSREGPCCVWMFIMCAYMCGALRWWLPGVPFDALGAFSLLLPLYCIPTSWKVKHVTVIQWSCVVSTCTRCLGMVPALAGCARRNVCSCRRPLHRR